MNGIVEQSCRLLSGEKSIIRLWVLVLLSLLGLTTHRAMATQETALLAAEDSMAQGWQAFQRGAFAEAVEQWRLTVQLAEKTGNQGMQRRVLLHLAQAYQALGQYGQALRLLEPTVLEARQAGDQAHLVMLLGHLGELYRLQGALQKTHTTLEEGLRLARALERPDLVAVLLNTLGNVWTAQQQDREALQAYGESVSQARQGHLPLVMAQALTNAALAAVRLQQPQHAKEDLANALQVSPTILPSHEKIQLLLNIGLASNRVRALQPEAYELLMLQAAAVFQEAEQIAQDLEDQLALSYAWGYLGQLYETEQRYDEAARLTRQALFAAQQRAAPEALYVWQWQMARLEYAGDHLDAAIAFYRQAITTLQSFRGELEGDFGRGWTSFRAIAEPVYYGFIDVLLQRATGLSEEAQLAPYLYEAREVVEKFKAVELQDYFQDSCVEAARARVRSLDETLTTNVVVIYPIVLADRLEILVSLSTGLQRVTVQVPREALVQTVTSFRSLLVKRATRQYLVPAQQLYDWLIRPLHPLFASSPIDTLVFVPDGPLRTIPMAALHDGEHFLIERYALALTPSLSLTDPRPLQRTDAHLLTAGLTEAVQGFSALPHVAAELDALEHLYGSENLRNQRFRVASLAETLQKTPFTMVHIATHGQFDRDVTKTFLLTYDGKLTMDRLDQVIGLFTFPRITW